MSIRSDCTLISPRKLSKLMGVRKNKLFCYFDMKYLHYICANTSFLNITSHYWKYAVRLYVCFMPTVQFCLHMPMYSQLHSLIKREDTLHSSIILLHETIGKFIILLAFTFFPFYSEKKIKCFFTWLGRKSSFTGWHNSSPYYVVIQGLDASNGTQ